MDWNKRKYVWLLVDASAALTDQILDMIMLYEYAANDDWDFFFIGLSAILIPSLLTGLFGLVHGSNFAAHERLVLCFNFLPGINLIANAARLLRAFLGECFEDRGEDWVDRWYNKYEDEYVFARFVEAMLEAGPQTVLQAFVALRRPEGINPLLLYASMAFSIFSIAKTLVTTLVFGYKGGSNSPIRPMSYPEKWRMFLLSFTYQLCEVVSRVFSVSLLGYFCGGYVMAAFLAGEYALFFAILAAGGACTGNNACGNGGANCALGLLGSPLLLMATSLMCCGEFPFRMFLPLRLLILGAYGVTSWKLEHNDAELSENAEVFFWAAVVANAAWALLMPAFVNSCHNLEISLNYTYFEPRSFTNGCYYPLQVCKDDGYEGGMCGCIYNKKAAEVADGATDIAEIVIGSC
mmetsp:Transcript_20203/g.42310  ORF Transcript_20203/g.42310 Transcript_20203/m.42310 type:complete len:407 (-) Transcript_20203:185-1405(-)